MSLLKTVITTLLLCTVSSPLLANEEAESESKKLMIGKDLYSLTVTHDGQPIEIVRNQDRDNLIDEYYRTTGRGRITPMQPFGDHAVETIGELEIIDYLQQKEAGDASIIVIDSRTVGGFMRGTIPGAVNISFREFSKKNDPSDIFKTQFNVPKQGDDYDFSQAKTLVMFCNGAWCRQSITAIKRLIKLGYPVEKIKYYRGGMQSWHSFGLTVVIP